ncbi:hypothetical protein Bca52824_011321 [Brassica carinata]|uniref:Uncharacterized protein n=1 Tax=Brassica carinata TaxID=52824 RepID=A0A8X7WD05_BRACI|nr:hypothetical protein Bca52824_011321 [Brassica carinata]
MEELTKKLGSGRHGREFRAACRCGEETSFDHWTSLSKSIERGSDLVQRGLALPLDGRTDAGKWTRNTYPGALMDERWMAGARLDMLETEHPHGIGRIRSSDMDWCAGQYVAAHLIHAGQAAGQLGHNRLGMD